MEPSKYDRDKFRIKRPFFIVVLLLLLPFYTNGTIRYVSKTGFSTPPYLTWGTAADSIQKCINVCNDGDTIYVGNGIYRESLVVNKVISLFGSSMDEVVIDGTGLQVNTVYVPQSVPVFNIQNFTIKGKDLTGIAVYVYNIANISSCKITNSKVGIVSRNLSVDKVIITKSLLGIHGASNEDTSHHIISNSVIVLDDNDAVGIDLYTNGHYKIFNNLLIWDGPFTWPSPVAIRYHVDKIEIKNNLIAGFGYGIDYSYAYDSAFIYNNLFFGNEIAFDLYDSRTVLRNCIFQKCKLAIYSSINTFIDYNVFWNNVGNFYHNIIPGSHTFMFDPMLMKEDKPDSTLKFDFHLQKYSPCIDSGDPGILDKNGSRSDIGLYGGPQGDTYSYSDLAPKAPPNYCAYVRNGQVILQWNKSTEADVKFYNVYRDTAANFPIDSTRLISRQSDTLYIENLPKSRKWLYYKLTAEDIEGNVSESTEEKIIIYTSDKDDYNVIDSYKLYQNHPNPFNPSTTISYRLKERGYVKLMFYDIKGELIKTLVNKEQEAGYYETEFDGSNLASGIYLYRIEVIGARNIPVFSDMRKTILIK